MSNLSGWFFTPVVIEKNQITLFTSLQGLTDFQKVRDNPSPIGINHGLLKSSVASLKNMQLVSENQPSQSAEKGGSEEKSYRGYIKKTLQFILSFGLIVLSLIGINKSFNLNGYLGGVLLVFCFLPFAGGVCCFLYGFLNLTFP